MSPGGGAAFAAVAVPLPVRRLFTYRVPAPLRGSVGVGTPVRVPFGRRRMRGTVVALEAAPPPEGVEVKDVQAVLDASPVLPPDVLELTRFVADYYLCSWGEAIEAALPPSVRLSLPAELVRRAPGRRADEIPARAKARRAAFESLPAGGQAIPLARMPAARRSHFRRLAADGLVLLERSEETAPTGLAVAAAGPVPTPAQARVLEAIEKAFDRAAFAPYVLYGATGSGKTEVYLRAAAMALARGRSVLWLVPEIGLTPLLAERVEARFPGTRAIAFGHLGDGNVHFHVLAPPDAVRGEWDRTEGPAISSFVYDLVTEWNGSISAEHGIGQIKVGELARLGDPVHLAIMRSVKQALDPKGLLNPGKLLP